MEKVIIITMSEDETLSLNNKGFENIEAIGVLTHCASRMSEVCFKTEEKSTPKKKKNQEPGEE